MFKKTNKGMICIKFIVVVLVEKLGYEIGGEQIVSILSAFNNS